MTVTWNAEEAQIKHKRINASNLPSNLATIVKLAKDTISPSKIWLFGSRARGEAIEKSDFDLAFRFRGSKEDWTIFVNRLEAWPPTLHGYDLVNFNDVDDSLRAVIEKQGIVIYEE